MNLKNFHRKGSKNYLLATYFENNKNKQVFQEYISEMFNEDMKGLLHIFYLKHKIHGLRYIKPNIYIYIYIYEQTSDNVIISIPDCFVSPILKFSNGKNGHGERRLYVGNEHTLHMDICKKPWKIVYPKNYKQQIDEIVDNSSLFSKPCSDRKKKVFMAIDQCCNKIIHIVPQNGNRDVRRYYIGPNKYDKNNIQLYDSFRLTLIPKIYSLKLDEYDKYFICSIVKSDSIHKKHKYFSHACIEYLNFLQHKYGIEIQSENNKGEFQLRNPSNGYYWPVDGYHNCKIHECIGNKDYPCPFYNHIWEFYGDYYHGNPTKYSEYDLFHNKSYSKKHDKDRKKIKFYQDNGYTVHIKWENDWIEDKKFMKKNNIQYLFD